MKDFGEVQEFLDSINEMPVFSEFKRLFLKLYAENLADKTMWVEYSTVIKGLSYDLDKSTLFITFVSNKSYAYYNVPVDIFLCGAFTDYLNTMKASGDLPKDFFTDENEGGLSMGSWFNEIVKDYFDYTLIN